MVGELCPIKNYVACMGFLPAGSKVKFELYVSLALRALVWPTRTNACITLLYTAVPVHYFSPLLCILYQKLKNATLHPCAARRTEMRLTSGL